MSIGIVKISDFYKITIFFCDDKKIIYEKLLTLFKKNKKTDLAFAKPVFLFN